MRGHSIVDLRNIYKPEDVRRRGFAYVGVGSNGAAADYRGVDPGE